MPNLNLLVTSVSYRTPDGSTGVYDVPTATGKRACWVAYESLERNLQGILNMIRLSGIEAKEIYSFQAHTEPIDQVTW